MHVAKAAVAAAALLLVQPVAAASKFSIASEDDIKATAATVAYDLMTYYKGNQSGMTLGILPGPPPNGDYYWWQAGAMWGGLIDYWYMTGDSSYNEAVMQAMLHQAGPNHDYQPNNWTASLGNDDQGFWGMTAMLAAELNFPNPPKDKPQWLALAQAVFNTQASPDRHDNTCGGGLRWQIPLSNNGYNYKNSIANGCFFNLGARLGRYLNNDTYIKWASDTYDWMRSVNFIDKDYNVYDGAHVDHDCKDINRAQFSYNVGVWAQGAAYLYEHTKDPKWKTARDGLINNLLSVFFPEGIAYEIACEGVKTCTTDMLTFKGFVHRWLSEITWFAPDLSDRILPVLEKSAAAAIKTCTGGEDGRRCGFTWSKGVFDKEGAGQQMNVVAAVSSLLVTKHKGPVTESSGGTSQGDYNAGQNTDSLAMYKKLGTADRAGAGIITLLILGSMAGLLGWMSVDA